jgi:hypothetical protein
MQIDAGQPACPACGAALEFFPVLHHMICAFVGPQYDFAPAHDGCTCPKCRRDIVSADGTCEIERALSPVPQGICCFSAARRCLT